MAIQPLFAAKFALPALCDPIRVTSTTPSDSGTLVRFKLLHSIYHRIISHMDIAIHRRLNASMTEQFLQNLRLHTTLNCPSCIGMAKRVHTKSLDSRLIAKLIQVGIIGAILVRHPSSEIDEDQISHNKLRFDTRSPVNILQGLREHWRFFSVSPT